MAKEGEWIMWKEGFLLKPVALIRLECWAWGWLGLAWGCLCHSILGRSEPEWMSPDSRAWSLVDEFAYGCCFCVERSRQPRVRTGQRFRDPGGRRRDPFIPGSDWTGEVWVGAGTRGPGGVSPGCVRRVGASGRMAGRGAEGQ